MKKGLFRLTNVMKQKSRLLLIEMDICTECDNIYLRPIISCKICVCDCIKLFNQELKISVEMHKRLWCI